MVMSGPAKKESSTDIGGKLACRPRCIVTAPIPMLPFDKPLRKTIVRWKELREARKQSNERTRSELEVAREKSGPVSSVAALSRATVLADGRKNAEAAVRDFLDHAAGGPMVVEAETAASAAAEDLVTAYEAVKSSIAAAGVSSEDRDTGAVGLLEMLREDTAIRAAASQKAIRAWWELQREALEQGLREREKEAEERRRGEKARQLASSQLLSVREESRARIL